MEQVHGKVQVNEEQPFSPLPVVHGKEQEEGVKEGTLEEKNKK